MSNQSNTQRGLVIAAETQGLNPSAIVGRENLVASPTNVNAYGPLQQDSDRAPDVAQREMDWSDKSHPAGDYGGRAARGYSRKGDPFAGKG